MPGRRGYADPADDWKKQYQRPKGTGSIEMHQRPDGRYRVSVLRADGKGRRYGYIRARKQVEEGQDAYKTRVWDLLQAKLLELTYIEAGLGEHGDEQLANQLDDMMGTWMNARNDPRKRDWVIRQWVKLFRLPPSLEDEEEEDE